MFSLLYKFILILISIYFVNRFCILHLKKNYYFEKTKKRSKVIYANESN